MTAVVVSNTTEANEDDLEVPVKEDGAPYRFEMLFNGLVDRAYADTAEELLACMIPQYETMTDGEKLAARLSHAVRTQTTVQADINWHYNNLVDNTPEEIEILSGTRSEPPVVETWSSNVPIVLVDVFYQPLGSTPQPVSSIADVENPPNMFWLRVEEEYEYLKSLNTVGAIELNMHNDYQV